MIFGLSKCDKGNGLPCCCHCGARHVPTDGASAYSVWLFVNGQCSIILLPKIWMNWLWNVSLFHYCITLPCSTNKEYWLCSWPNYSTWWCHQMETFSVLLAFCVGNSLVIGEIPAQRPVTRSFDVFFDLCLKQHLRKQWRCWWFEKSLCSLWHHCNEDAMITKFSISRYYVQQWQQQGINQTLSSQNTPHILHIYTSYVASDVQFLEHTDHLITAQHCMELAWIYSKYASKKSHVSVYWCALHLEIIQISYMAICKQPWCFSTFGQNKRISYIHILQI